MKENDFALYQGCIYKKIIESEYTYIYCSAVREYLLNMLGNSEVADVITPYINHISNLLSEPSCKLIKPIVIDFNYIEVNDGVCFDIERKCLLKVQKK